LFLVFTSANDIGIAGLWFEAFQNLSLKHKFRILVPFTIDNPLKLSVLVAGILKSNSNQVVIVDLISLDNTAISVGSAVVITSLVFGIRLESVSPVATLISATGTILKL